MTTKNAPITQRPRTLDPSILIDFKDSFNLLQDISADSSVMTKPQSYDKYIAQIQNGFVEGEYGLVYDQSQNVYHLDDFFHNRTNPILPFPTHTVQQAQQRCSSKGNQYKELASIIQRYGHMYYHFLIETLPRVVLLKQSGALTPSTKILTWGQPYEAAWLAKLGIDPEQLVTFDPEAVYCADTLYIPTPIPRITPPKEALVDVRNALNIKTLPAEDRTDIIYVSRSTEPTRRVDNEDAILGSLSRAFGSTHNIVVFNGSAAAHSPQETVDMFQRARVIVGPHGAGLSHLLFSAPNTSIVEFLFMADPPMMFWHCAGALDQEYWLLPVPQSYYMQRSMHVPENEVLDIMNAIFASSDSQTQHCSPGSAGPLCTACPPGSYSFISTKSSNACKVCAEGRYSKKKGSTACKTCKPGTYSNRDATDCLPCPPGTYSTLAGSSSVDQCLGAEARRARLEEQALSTEMMSKLSPTFAKQIQRRLLIQGSNAVLTQQELCAALKSGSGFGTYGGNVGALSGPYANSLDIVCPPSIPSPSISSPNTTVQPPLFVSPPSPVPPPYGIVDLPPIDIGILPQQPEIELPPPTNGTQPLPLPPIQLPLPPNDTQPLPLPPGYENNGDQIQQPPTTDPNQPSDTSKSNGKHVLDTWAIALIATACVLITIPLMVCCGMWCMARRRRSKQARAAASAKQASSQQFATSNPTFNATSSTSSGGSGHGQRHAIGGHEA